MHEMSLAEGVLQIIEDASRTQAFRRVTSVWLEIGQLSGVESEAIRFCFDAVTRGTIADGASLEIVPVVGQAWCMRCSRQVPIGGTGEPCPDCGSYQLQITGGTEMRVKELAVE